MPEKGNATSCEASAECGSGFCVDGVCCDSACEGSCVTCSQAGSVGVCTHVIGAAATGRTACTGDGVCSSSCDGVSVECVFPGTETVCSPGFCSDAVITPASKCDGQSQCIAGEQTKCGMGCADDHCATLVKMAPGCASTEPVALGALLMLALALGRRRSRQT